LELPLVTDCKRIGVDAAQARIAKVIEGKQANQSSRYRMFWPRRARHKRSHWSSAAVEESPETRSRDREDRCACCYKSQLLCKRSSARLG
jgi:hypothetical protein